MNTVQASSQSIFLIAFNSKVGMKLVLDSYFSYFSKIFDTYVFSDKKYQYYNENDFEPKCKKFIKITHSDSHFKMALDCINPIVYFKILYFIIVKKPSVIYFISAHPLNVITALITHISTTITGFKVFIVSHIHDVVPHSNTSNSFFIDFFQKLQVKLSDKITVYGEFLKNQAIEHFKLQDSDVYSYLHGVNRLKDRDLVPSSRSGKTYVSFIGRIEAYKGIDTFLKIAQKFKDSHLCEFLIAGSGDLSAYSKEIESLSNVKIINRFLSDDEIDELLSSSYLSVLPYNDASQTGVIQVSYFNACPVLVSNVGGLPENVIHGETGFVVQPRDVESFSKYIELILTDIDLRNYLTVNCFEFYKSNLKWNQILSELTSSLFSIHK